MALEMFWTSYYQQPGRQQSPAIGRDIHLSY